MGKPKTIKDHQRQSIISAVFDDFMFKFYSVSGNKADRVFLKHILKEMRDFHIAWAKERNANMDIISRKEFLDRLFPLLEEHGAEYKTFGGNLKGFVGLKWDGDIDELFK